METTDGEENDSHSRNTMVDLIACFTAQNTTCLIADPHLHTILPEHAFEESFSI